MYVGVWHLLGSIPFWDSPGERTVNPQNIYILWLKFEWGWVCVVKRSENQTHSSLASKLGLQGSSIQVGCKGRVFLIQQKCEAG